MKRSISRTLKRAFAFVLLGIASLTLASCSLEDLFVFGGVEINQDDIETFEGDRKSVV